MRIQVLALPPQPSLLGPVTPFVLAIDDLSIEQEADIPFLSEFLREKTGARMVIFIGNEERLEISPALELPEELQQQLITLLTARTEETGSR